MDFEIQTWVKMSAFAGGGIAMGLGAIGAAVGEGNAAQSANQAISRQPELSGEILKTLLVGQAIAESAAIFALVVAMTLLFSTFSADSIMVSVVMSAGLAMGLGAIGSGAGSGLPAGSACTGISRQPKMSSKITTNMLIGSAVCQTPSIFALVTAFILLFTTFSGRPVSPTWAAIMGAGLAVGLASIGSGLGGGLVAEKSCEGIARQPNSSGSTTMLMLLAQAVTQTPTIYGLLVAFILLFKSSPAADSIAPAIALLGSGLCMGLGAIGPGWGIGYSGGMAVRWSARNEKAVTDITKVMLLGQAGVSSTAIYSLLIALVLIFIA